MGKPPPRVSIVQAAAITDLVVDLLRLKTRYERSKLTAVEYVEQVERRIAEHEAARATRRQQ